VTFKQIQAARILAETTSIPTAFSPSKPVEETASVKVSEKAEDKPQEPKTPVAAPVVETKKVEEKKPAEKKVEETKVQEKNVEEKKTVEDKKTVDDKKTQEEKKPEDKKVADKKTATTESATLKTYTTTIETVTGLTPADIKAGCVYALDAKYNLGLTASKGSAFAPLLFVCLSLAAVVFGLSYYYKDHLVRNKQAPFPVPSWAPEALFPKFDFYYEHELSRRLRSDLI